jgi:hypothetical protein
VAGLSSLLPGAGFKRTRATHGLVDTSPTTTSLAAMPVRSRHCRSACTGWIAPADVSLSV